MPLYVIFYYIAFFIIVPSTESIISVQFTYMNFSSIHNLGTVRLLSSKRRECFRQVEKVFPTFFNVQSDDEKEEEKKAVAQIKTAKMKLV